MLGGRFSRFAINALTTQHEIPRISGEPRQPVAGVSGRRRPRPDAILSPRRMDLAQFNTADEADLRGELLACCDVLAWADAVLAGRPYGDLSELGRRAKGMA